ncbi:MAG: hypothetical protein JSS81_00165 [Acidobacteria bacterium]|nr:hypothetical protein [Acidobacteriota bacterium]
MDEKLAIETFIKLRNQWLLMVRANRLAEAGKIFREMVELGNKYPQLANLVNTSRLGPAMIEAGFTAGEASTAVGVIGAGGVAAETGAVGTGLAAGGTALATGTAPAAGMTIGGVMATVGWVIAVAVILGCVAYVVYLMLKRKEHNDFVNMARNSLGRSNFGIKPILGRAH